MFDCTPEILSQGRVHKYSVTRHGKPLSYGEVLNLWQHHADFRTFFISLLSDSPFSAYRWETPPITTDTTNRPFEFVLLNSPELIRTADANTYAAYFTTNDNNNGIVTFENLGKDAILIVPSPCCSESVYNHLANFIRHGPPAQIHALWCNVGQIIQQQITDSPLWLSTAGGGVSWLHIRLDYRPKYYGYKPYKQFS